MKHLAAVLQMPLGEFLERVGAAIYAEPSYSHFPGEIKLWRDGIVLEPSEEEPYRRIVFPAPPKTKAKAFTVAVTLTFPPHPWPVDAATPRTLFSLQRQQNISNTIFRVLLKPGEQLRYRLETNLALRPGEVRSAQGSCEMSPGKPYRFEAIYQLRPKALRLIIWDVDSQRRIEELHAEPEWRSATIRWKEIALTLGGPVTKTTSPPCYGVRFSDLTIEAEVEEPPPTA